jgi:imidazole glycerol phosphate synthase glutamine amidotransferase subunit
MMNKKIAVVDHGIGNIRSVKNALDYLGFESYLANSPNQLFDSDVVLLPGVGNFGGVMNALDDRGLTEVLHGYLSAERPLVGICVGMQVLLEGTSESPDVPGFGFLKGKLQHLSSLDPSQVTPSIGWKTLTYRDSSKYSSVLKEAYFVHSYFASGVPIENIVSTYQWNGQSIPSHVALGRVHGVQFHPEKSRLEGLQFLRTVIEDVTK